MEHVDGCDLVAIEFVPEGVAGVGVVEQERVRAKNNDFGSFTQKDFSFVRVGGETV